MEPKLGIKPNHQKASAKLLAELLSDEMVLYVKTLNFHWNVRGLHFGPLHKLFKKQYEMLAEWLDEIAERIRTLGADAPGSMNEFLKLASLKESTKRPKEKEMLKTLLQDQEKLIRSMRAAIDKVTDDYNDVGTADFLTALLENHEQIAWMTRSHLE